jgi:hypothetical protein
MKKILILMIMLAFNELALATSPDHPLLPRKDTVVISFGNNSKILILVDNPEELKKIGQYDINAMLEDLSLSIDSMDEKEQYLRFEDESGENYLRDTSILISSAEAMDIEQLKESIKVEVKEELRDEYAEAEKKKKNKNKRTRHYFNIELGKNNYLQGGQFPDANNELYSVKPWGSWYVGLSGTNRTQISGPLYLDWGGGISWYNFKHQNFSTRLEQGDSEVIYYDDPDVPSPLKSKLSISHLNLHLVPMLNFGKSGGKKDIFHWDYHNSGFRVGLGGYLGYRIKSWTKYTWREEGRRMKDHDYRNFFLNNLRYGMKFVVGYRSIDLFLNYDISELYAEDRGPRLNAFSFGIIL